MKRFSIWYERASPSTGWNLFGILSPAPFFFGGQRSFRESTDQRHRLSEPDPISHWLEAIPNEEIVVHDQPMISMADRTICRVEALVRWRHPQLGT